MKVCFEDEEFKKLFNILSEEKQAILKWKLDKYIWTSLQRAKMNISFSKGVVSRQISNIL